MSNFEKLKACRNTWRMTDYIEELMKKAEVSKIPTLGNIIMVKCRTEKKNYK